MSWEKPFKINGDIRSWAFKSEEPWHESGDGHTFMSLHVPNIRRADEDYYVLLIHRHEVQGRIEFHAPDHETAKREAVKLARQYLARLQVECRETLDDIVE